MTNIPNFTSILSSKEPNRAKLGKESKTMSHRGLLHHIIINVSNVERSSPFYTAMFSYFGYELTGSSYGENYGYEDWKRWDLDTPHEISICQVCDPNKDVPHRRGAVGHHDHIAFCAEDRDDVDRFYREVLKPLDDAGLCVVEDAPCDCPEYNDGYYATFFTDPDGLKYEFVLNPNHLIKKAQRQKLEAEQSETQQPPLAALLSTSPVTGTSTPRSTLAPGSGVACS